VYAAGTTGGRTHTPCSFAHRGARTPQGEAIPNLSLIQSSKRTLGFAVEQRVHAHIIHANAGNNMSKTNALLTRIAQTKLRIETLETRGSDRLDFHDMSVESLREALKAAYNAGIEQGRKTKAADKSAD
jgi:hypothetical protein